AAEAGVMRVVDQYHAAKVVLPQDFTAGLIAKFAGHHSLVRKHENKKRRKHALSGGFILPAKIA
ncbi:MAG TPA: hypothetical protein VK938_04375, partial [Methylophilaceae bacterium]|nr:hypothetical protein [Methylophilaceae bacterium]